MAINVYYNYYVPNDAARAAELLSCFGVLYADRSIDRIVLLAESLDPPSDDRLEVLRVTGRPTFEDYFQAIAAYSGRDDVNVILNSDCFIDPRTTRQLHKIQNDQAYCITRHELSTLIPMQIDYKKTTEYARRFLNNMQDCWVIRGQPRSGMWLDFSPGRLGCDNRLAYELQSRGYVILDPHLTVRILHYHGSAYGTQNRGGDVVPPPYAYPAKYGFRERFGALLIEVDLRVRRMWNLCKGALRRAVVGLWS